MSDIRQTMWVQEDIFARAAYNWMHNEMCDNVSAPPENVKYPIWAWYSFRGKRKKPDMRASGFASRGTPVVRLSLNVPEKEVLLSDFDLWHYPLNNWYLAVSEAEELQFDQIGGEKKQSLITDSWRRIYNLDAEDDGYIWGKRERRSIQGTFWQLKEEYILSVETFTAR